MREDATDVAVEFLAERFSPPDHSRPRRGKVGGGAGVGEGVAAVLFGNLADVGAIAQPRKLIGEECAEQFAVAAHLFVGEARVEFDALGEIERLVTTARGAVRAAVGLEHVEPGTGKERHEGPGLRFIHGGADAGAHRHPFLEGEVAVFEEEAEFLAIEAPGLGEAVVKINERTAGVAGGALHLFLQAGAGPQGALRGDDLSRAEPTFEEVEEVDAVLDENAAAFRRVPKPMIGPEAFVARGIVEGTAQAGAERAGFDEPADGVEDRVVTLHEIGHAKEFALAGEGEEFVRLGDGEGEGFFAKDVLSREEGGAGLGEMEEGRSGDVNEIDIGSREEGFRLAKIGRAKPLGHGERAGIAGAGDAREAGAGDLEELLDREEPKAPSADDSDT